MSGDLSLVPPARLGALLTHERTTRGLTVDDLERLPAVGFAADELRQIEQGQLSLSDDQINRLMIAYGVGSGALVPERSELVVDLHHGALFAGSKTRVLPKEADLDDILGRYLSLLYLMRDMGPGRELALRGRDLEVLSQALARSVDELEQRLAELMLPNQALPWFDRLRHRLGVPAAGLLVGLTSVGSLVLIQFPKGERPSTPEPTSEGSVGTTAAPADSLGAIIIEPGADIGVPAAATRIAGGEASVYEPGEPGSVGAAAERLISYPFRSLLPGWTIAYESPRDGYLGNTNTVTRTITVHVSSLDTPATVAGVLAHEIGHALDVMYLDDDARARWLDERNLDVAWWPKSGAGDFGVGAGDFAEAVAALIAASPSDSEHGAFSARQLQVVAELIPPGTPRS